MSEISDHGDYDLSSKPAEAEPTATLELTADELHSLLVVAEKVLAQVPRTPPEFQRACTKIVIARASLDGVELDDLHREGIEILKEVHGL